MAQPSKQVPLQDQFDVVIARQTARDMAREIGFALTDQARIATAVSEVARRALKNRGSIAFAPLMQGTQRGLECTCLGCDWENGSTPPAKAPTGRVLEGVEKLMDSFEHRRENGQQAIVMQKWLPPPL